MPNLYVTPSELKDQAPDNIRQATSKYDDSLLRVCQSVSRWIDTYCRRVFYPTLATRYFRGNGSAVLRIPDVMSVSAISYSEDDGQTYTALSESGNWYLARSGGPAAWEYDFDHPGSFDLIVLDPNGDITSWPKDFRGIKITGVWAYADDQTESWLDTGITLSSDPGSGSTLSLDADPAGNDLFGVSPAIAAGMLLRLESEYLECTATSSSPDQATVLRGRNGSSTAAHASGTACEIWRVPDPVRQAAEIQVVREFFRAQQGFQDSRANPDLGDMSFVRRVDPEAETLLAPYRLMRVPA